jgi:hypothetical protein
LNTILRRLRAHSNWILKRLRVCCTWILRRLRAHYMYQKLPPGAVDPESHRQRSVTGYQYQDIEETEGTFCFSQTPSWSSQSRISQAKISLWISVSGYQCLDISIWILKRLRVHCTLVFRSLRAHYIYQYLDISTLISIPGNSGDKCTLYLAQFPSLSSRSRISQTNISILISGPGYQYLDIRT